MNDAVGLDLKSVSASRYGQNMNEVREQLIHEAVLTTRKNGEWAISINAPTPGDALKKLLEIYPVDDLERVVLVNSPGMIEFCMHLYSPTKGLQ